MGAAQGKAAGPGGKKSKKHGRPAGPSSSHDSPLAKRSPKASTPRASPPPGAASPAASPSRSSSEKENVENVNVSSTPSSQRPTPQDTPTGKRVEVREEMTSSQQRHVTVEAPRHVTMEPLTPLVIHGDNQDPRGPQAQSTPHARSPPLSPDSGTDQDQSDDDAFTSPSDAQMFSPSSLSFTFNSSTSTGFASMRNSRVHSDSIESRRSTPNFGRFYNTSYLGLARGGGGGAQPQKQRRQSGPANFSRPPNFTYSKDPPDFLKKKASGMSALGQVKRVVKVRRSSSPGNLRNQEAVRMSMFPAAKPKEEDEVDKIERDDWPCPAAPAALLPQILRERRRSRGADDGDEDDAEIIKENPKILQKLEEISKIKETSGIGRAIYRQLEDLKARPPQPLDPWKASRAPSAKFEPRYRTRFQSPMFASPSRFLDRPRYAWDDMDIRTYRSVSALANLPTPKPGYGPSYMTPRAATLPLAGAFGARDDFRFFDFGEHDDTSCSTLTGNTSYTRHDNSYYDVPQISLLKLQKSTWHTEAQPQIYPYEQIKITNFDLPKDCDTNKLEIHLGDDEFENLFSMPRDKFYRLAEWKRNDMKRKLHLY